MFGFLLIEKYYVNILLQGKADFIFVLYTFVNIIHLEDLQLWEQLHYQQLLQRIKVFLSY